MVNVVFLLYAIDDSIGFPSSDIATSNPFFQSISPFSDIVNLSIAEHHIYNGLMRTYEWITVVLLKDS